MSKEKEVRMRVGISLFVSNVDYCGVLHFELAVLYLVTH